jgi:hypothetical protein
MGKKEDPTYLLGLYYLQFCFVQWQMFEEMDNTFLVFLIIFQFYSFLLIPFFYTTYWNDYEMTSRQERTRLMGNCQYGGTNFLDDCSFVLGINCQ